MPSKSKSQQRFFGLVRSVQKGDTPRKSVSKSVRDAADSMKVGDVKDFASTGHKGLPEHVSESVLRRSIMEAVRSALSDLRKWDMESDWDERDADYSDFNKLTTPEGFRIPDDGRKKSLSMDDDSSFSDSVPSGYDIDDEYFRNSDYRFSDDDWAWPEQFRLHRTFSDWDRADAERRRDESLRRTVADTLHSVLMERYGEDSSWYARQESDPGIGSEMCPYDSYVVVDEATEEILGNYDDESEAVADADEMSSVGRGRYLVIGCNGGVYSFDDVVHDTDPDVSYKL